MMLSKRESNKFYEAIVKTNFDPADFEFENADDRVLITHNSGSTFEVIRTADRTSWGSSLYPYHIKYRVVEGIDRSEEDSSIDSITIAFEAIWLREIKETVGVPDYWKEMSRSQESIAIIRREDFDNTPFTQDEQRQISVRFQEIKNQLERFQLPGEQMSQIVERLDRLEEDSHHLGRKDWLIIFITTLSPLVVGDILTSGLARHIFTLIINGLIHMFGGGPPQLLS